MVPADSESLSALIGKEMVRKLDTYRPDHALPLACCVLCDLGVDDTFMEANVDPLEERMGTGLVASG